MNLRRLLLLEVMVGLFVSSSHLTAQSAQSVSLAWNASPSTEVTSYIVRYGTASRVYSLATNVGNQTTATVTGLQPGQTYYLVVAALTATGLESLPSNETSYQVPIAGVPVVTLTAPNPNAMYAAPAIINCAAAVTPNGRTITKVQFFNGGALLGEDSSAPYNFSFNGVAAGTYPLMAHAVYDSGSSVVSEMVNVSVTNPPPANGLTFEPDAGVITGPFAVTAGILSQSSDTGLSTGGRAVYDFTVVTPGDYTVSAIVDAPNSSQNSLFVNIDGEPTDPDMVWHIPFTTGLESRTVSWQGNGTFDNSQFAPKVFTLAAGPHQLIIRGRESDVKLGTITIAPVTPVVLPTIALTSPADGAGYFSAATIDLAASVTANGHPITAVQFFNGTTFLSEDASAPYSYTWNEVAAGNYTLSARIVYGSGSIVTSAPAIVTVNPVVLPTIALTSPATDASYLSPATVNLAASVTENGHTITAVQFFNGTTLLSEDASAPYSYTWSGVAAGNYTLSARIVYGSGNTITSSSANIAVTPPPVAYALTFESDAGVITAPFAITGGTLSQSMDTTLGNGGRAVYTFTIVTPGDYTVSANVDAPNSSRNSFFVNIDGEPTDPEMVWHIPYTTGLENRTVSWQGGGTFDASEFVPKVFTLTAGNHQLIIRGRESYVELGTITIAPVQASIPPTVTLTVPADGATYASPATVDLSADVTANGHTITKVQFFNDSILLGEATSSPYTYTWSNVVAGTYNLVARTAYDFGSTVDSETASITVAGLLPPWQTVDIGTVELPGSASEISGVYTVRGAGRLTGTSDSFRFVHQPLSADGEITMRLNSVQAANSNGSFGVMIRESLAPNSRYSFLGVSQDLLFRSQRRNNTGGNTYTTVATAAALPNAWVRLVRSGNTLTGYWSADGTNWTAVNSRNISMAANVYVGLVVASGSADALNTVTFSNGIVVP